MIYCRIHESGHALLSFLTPNYPKVDKVTILPRGNALGYVSNLADESVLYNVTKQDLINRIDVALAGRIAEEVVLGSLFRYFIHFQRKRSHHGSFQRSRKSHSHRPLDGIQLRTNRRPLSMRT